MLDSNAEAYLLAPQKLVAFLISKGVKYSHFKIDYWDLFEIDKKYYSYDEVIEFIYHEITNDEKLFLITDEGIKDKIVFEIPTKQMFLDFVFNYEEKYNMDFMQPADYIAYFPKEKKLNLIYHEGIFFSFKLE